MKSKFINVITRFMGNDDIIYNKGICRKCNDIYILKDKPMSLYKSKKVYFTCKCNNEYYYVFSKRKCHDLMRYFVIHHLIKAYMAKTYSVEGIVDPYMLNRIDELKRERESISSKKVNRRWRDKIYENIS